MKFLTESPRAIVAPGLMDEEVAADSHSGCVRLIWISWILWISPSSAHSIIVDFDMDFLDLGRFLGFLGLAISGLCTRVTSHAW